MSFLESTAASLVAKHGWQDMRSLTLVFPSHRAGLVLKDELKRMQCREGLPAVFLPEITTLTELFDSLSPLRAEEELDLVCRLCRIYRELTGETLTLDLFYGWGRQLIADFNNIDKSVPADGLRLFFENTIEAKQLESVELDDEVRQRLEDLLHKADYPAAEEDSVRHKFDLVWQRMYDIYLRFNAELAAEGKGYEGARMRGVVANWQQLRPQYEGRQFVFIGFNYLMPVEHDLMRLLYDQGQARFYWDYVPDFLPNAKAYAFIRRHIAEFGNEATPTEWGEPHPVEVVSATTANAQAQYVHTWLRAHYTHKGQRTAVVICDEQMLEPVIYALPAICPEGATGYEPINITKGFPFSSTQIFADIMAFLADKHNDRQASETYAEVLVRLLSQVVVPAERQAHRRAEDPALSRDCWQWLLVQESLYQARVALNKFIHLLSAPEWQQEIHSLVLLRSLLRRYLEGISLPFHGEPVTDISVMGVLETRGLDFDRLLLLNVEEGVVPRKQADLSFIPYYLRKTYTMQTRDESASVYAHNFFRLLSRAGQATIVFSNADTALGRKTMSRFLMQIMVSPRYFSVSRFVLAEDNRLRPAFEMDMESAPSLLSHLEQHPDGRLYYAGTERPYTLSPSALSTYIACPRQFFLRYVAGIEPTVRDGLIFQSNELGSFVHSAMEYIYRAFCHCSGSTRQSVSPDDLQRVYDNAHGEMRQAIEAAYSKQNEDYNRHNHLPEGTQHYIYEEHPLENRVIFETVRSFIAHDIADAKEGLQVVLLEQRRTFTVPLGIGQGSIQVGGTIDRLDICRGVLRVVDYKTGHYTGKKMTAEMSKLFSDPDSRYVLQTLVYSETIANADSQAYPLPLQPNLFFSQRKRNCEDTLVTLDKSPVRDYRDLRKDFVPALEEKVCEVLTTTSFPQVEETKCSAFCPYLEICARTNKANNV